MAKLFVFAAAFFISNCDLITGSRDTNDIIDKFDFTRKEPGNDLGITTKLLAHILRPAKQTTETWRFNREFTPPEVVLKLNETCSEKLIENKIKWNNCVLTPDGLTAELTHGTPEPKNKTRQYLELSYSTFERRESGKKQTCILAIVHENPVYFLLETYSKLPSNDTFPRTTEKFVDVVHQHQLGSFAGEFLGVYGGSIDQDSVYNFDQRDYAHRDELYECFLSIGGSESASVIEQKCPIKCDDYHADVNMRSTHFDEL